MEDKYYFKPTKINSLVKIGYIDLSNIDEYLQNQSPDKRWLSGVVKDKFLNIFNILNIEEVQQSCWYNPHKYENVIEWHNDAALEYDNRSMIICIKSDAGLKARTIFRKGKKIVQIKPNFIYWVREDLEHRAPSKMKDCTRLMLRFYCTKI